MPRVLALGTFPIVKPVHGGQRRIASIKRFYESIGVTYDHACVYDGSIYGGSRLGPHDIPLAPPPAEYRGVPFIADVLSGWQAADDPASYAHFAGLVERLRPDAIQLEHPFMWPLVRRLNEGSANPLPLIYSSHNVEAPLKHALMAQGRVAVAVRTRIVSYIKEIEAQIREQARLILCVSAVDGDHYLKQPAAGEIVIVRNGVDRAPAVIGEFARIREVFGSRPFLLTVGSLYPPNVTGACELLLRDGAFHSPAVKSLAVCGGMASGILQHPIYRNFERANDCRVEFFPTIEDDELWAIKHACHGVVLAIDPASGGTSLKTAEALVLGKWVIANSTALRGFEEFADAEGVIKADTRTLFRQAMARVLREPAAKVSDDSLAAREALYWDRCFADSALKTKLMRVFER